jgi:mannose-6-phosphate isomerase-like protein (cupin superfamily)
VFHIDGHSSPIESGMVVYVPPGAEQWVHNTGSSKLEFLCLVDPAWKPEDEHIME